MTEWVFHGIFFVGVLWFEIPLYLVRFAEIAGTTQYLHVIPGVRASVRERDYVIQVGFGRRIRAVEVSHDTACIAAATGSDVEFSFAYGGIACHVF
jgi:hypothetical protein